MFSAKHCSRTVRVHYSICMTIRASTEDSKCEGTGTNRQSEHTTGELVQLKNTYDGSMYLIICLLLFFKVC